MTTYLAHASGKTFEALWSHAAADTGMVVSFLRQGSRGRFVSDTIAELLYGSGRVQPTLLDKIRAVTRADLGRLQVGLQRSRRDIVLLHADRLKPLDRELFALCAARAGVDLYLVAEQLPLEPGDEIPDGLVLVDPVDMLATWAARDTAGGRGSRWPCHAALTPLSGMAAKCSEHSDAVECALAWFPHALQTAASTPRTVAVRLHELLGMSPEVALRVWPHARDVYRGCLVASDVIGLTARDHERARIQDLSDDASTIVCGETTYAVPELARDVLHVARADKLADGLSPATNLLGVRPSKISRYRSGTSRSGHRPPSAVELPAPRTLAACIACAWC